MDIVKYGYIYIIIIVILNDCHLKYNVSLNAYHDKIIYFHDIFIA